LLSNGLENAIFAAAACLDLKCRVVSFKALVHKNKLLISMDNPYSGEIKMNDRLPQSSLEGHGYGTRSITAIADAHGGQAIFSAKDGIFTLKIMIPLRD
jgi:sensor histidine kinase YesM